MHVLGGADDSPYGLRIKSLAEQNRDWVFLEGWAVGETKKKLLASHKYGIHGRENEPFGIAVAEMVNAGCMVFVPKGGGQVEIVDNPALIFHNDADAVDKIDTILSTRIGPANALAHDTPVQNRFTSQNFVVQIQEIFKNFLQEEKGN